MLRNIIHSCEGCGIEVTGRETNPTLKENEVSRHTEDGVRVREGANPTAQDNRITVCTVCLPQLFTLNCLSASTVCLPQLTR